MLLCTAQEIRSDEQMDSCDKVRFGNQGADSDENFQNALSLRNRRIVLTSDEARAIFMSKPPLLKNVKVHTTTLAKVYGVSAKTIRDIWVGRTWYRATYFLDDTKAACVERLQKKLGRPRGAKDVRPRTKRMSALEQVESGQKYSLGSNFQQNIGTLLDWSQPKIGDEVKQGLPNFPASSGLKEATDWPSQDFEAQPEQGPVDWAAYLANGLGGFSQFTDPFHNDWAFWPNEVIRASRMT